MLGALLSWCIGLGENRHDCLELNIRQSYTAYGILQCEFQQAQHLAMHVIQSGGKEQGAADHPAKVRGRRWPVGFRARPPVVLPSQGVSLHRAGHYRQFSVQRGISAVCFDGDCERRSSHLRSLQQHFKIRKIAGVKKRPKGGELLSCHEVASCFSGLG